MALSRITNPFLSSSGSGNASITSPAANTIAFSTATTERMRIDSSGLVGIGTSSPTSKLTITGGSTEIRSGNALMIRPSDNSNDTRLVALTTGGLDVVWGGATSTSIMYWANGGNVGIGTTSPQGKLAVSSGGAQGIEFLMSSATAVGIQSYNRSTSAYVEQNYVGSVYTWTTGGVGERMRIDSSGNLLIGTTSSLARLTVSGSIAPVAAPSSFWGLDFAPSSASGTYITLANGATYDLAGGSGMVFIFEDGGSIGFAQLACVYGTTSVVWQSGTGYSNTSGTANKINFYYGPGLYRIQNSTGSSKSIWVSIMKMRASS